MERQPSNQQGAEQRPQIAQITPRQVEVLNRIDTVMGRFTRLVASIKSPYLTYTPTAETGGTQITIPIKHAEAGFARALVGLKLDEIDAGLVNEDDYVKLLRGEQGPPPVINRPDVDSDGHLMLKRGNRGTGSEHWYCPLDNTFRWETEL